MDLQEKFYCACCDVVFNERWPKYDDMTPCLGCDCYAICLHELEADMSIGNRTFYDLYDL